MVELHFQTGATAHVVQQAKEKHCATNYQGPGETGQDDQKANTQVRLRHNNVCPFPHMKIIIASYVK